MEGSWFQSYPFCFLSDYRTPSPIVVVLSRFSLSTKPLSTASRAAPKLASTTILIRPVWHPNWPPPSVRTRAPFRDPLTLIPFLPLLPSWRSPYGFDADAFLSQRISLAIWIPGLVPFSRYRVHFFPPAVGKSSQPFNPGLSFCDGQLLIIPTTKILRPVAYSLPHVLNDFLAVTMRLAMLRPSLLKSTL